MIDVLYTCRSIMSVQPGKYNIGNALVIFRVYSQVIFFSEFKHDYRFSTNSCDKLKYSLVLTRFSVEMVDNSIIIEGIKSFYNTKIVDSVMLVTWKIFRSVHHNNDNT